MSGDLRSVWSGRGSSSDLRLQISGVIGGSGVTGTVAGSWGPDAKLGTVQSALRGNRERQSCPTVDGGGAALGEVHLGPSLPRASQSETDELEIVGFFQQQREKGPKRRNLS